MTSLEKLTNTDFSSHLNQPFKLEIEPLPTILLQLRAVHNEAEGERRWLTTDRFVVVFNGPLRPLLPRQIYCLEHPTMGKVKFLFVPMGPSNGSMQYQGTVVA